MTQTAIKSEIESIKKATEKALRSEESARKFLIEAGIISGKKATKSKARKK